jgi:hypothetical protein
MAKKYQLRIFGALLIITILAIIQVVSAGNQQLTFSVTYGGNSFDTAYSLAWAFGNPSGKLYVVGSSASFSSPPQREGIVAMFDENLETLSNVVKMQGFSGWGEFYDVAVPIGISLSNTIAVVGYIPNNNRDPVVYWLDKSTLGTTLAYQLTVFSGSARDEAVSVSFDSQGNTIVAGFSDSGSPPLDNGVPFLVKINGTGYLVWSKAFRPVGAGPSYIGIPGISGALAIDYDNNIIVAGSVALPAGKDYDAFVAKFDPNGNILWYKTFGGSKREHAYGVALDNLGNIYVAGVTNSFSASATYDIFVARFDPNGNLAWFKVWDIDNVGANDVAYSIAVIQYDHIYITGVTFAYDSSGDMFFAKIAADGTPLYVIRSNMAGEDRGFKVALNIHSTNDVFYVNVAGISNANPTPSSFVSASFTVVASTITPTTHTTFNIANNIVTVTDITAINPLVDITASVSSPDNAGARAMVLKFDPPSVSNENKTSIPYISYLLIAAIISLIALIAVFIKRRI